MIRNFLFDIGNVLLHFDLIPALRKLNHRPDLSFEASMEILIHHRDLMEDGSITASQFLDGIMHDLAFPGTTEQARAIYAAIFTPNPPNWELAKVLKSAGYRLVLFSNISPIHADYVEEKYPDLALFDEAIFSFRVGDIKPRPGMYRYAQENLGMLPGETYFIDDKIENIETGKNMGFVTHHYDHVHHAALLEDLRARGIPVPA